MSRIVRILVSGIIIYRLSGQTKIDLQNQARGVDFSAATYTKPAKAGEALPSTCSTGEAFILTTAVPGNNFYICTATNTWSLQGSLRGTTEVAQLFAGFATDQATGDGSRAGFTLTNTPLSGALIVVTNGQVQEAGTLADYTLSGNTVTFNTASIPTNGARVSFHYGYSTDSTGRQIPLAQLPAGIANGLATLGTDGRVPTSQLPTPSANVTTGSQAFTSNGTFTVPMGVTRVFVQVWGGGGGGGAGRWSAGPGGSGGGYAQNWCAVTPGNTIPITIGVGGAGETDSNVPRAGGLSSFGGCAAAMGGGFSGNPGYDAALSTMEAMYFGTDTSGNNFRTYTLGMILKGLGNSNVYTPLRADLGGIGSVTSVNSPGNPGGAAIYGGGGGGGGPRDDTKANRAAGAGGKSGYGGSGGSSGYIASGSSQPCTAGLEPGGGGGGSAYDGGTYMPGCAGARGEVRVWW